MDSIELGILHPGNMGISVAVSAQNSGCRVHWVSAGRSNQTRERAEEHNLYEFHTLAELCATCSLLISVCPPSAAEEVAGQVLEHGYRGLYVDANAIAPQRALRIGSTLAAAGVDFVDGGIIGGPAWQAGQTWLYLSGERAPEVAACFTAGPLESTVIGSEIGQASALKMCYAAYTKGRTALLSAIVAAAHELDVWSELQTQWDRDWPEFSVKTTESMRRVTAKAWRFAGEMDEISATFESAGVPGGFHAAAGELYHRLAQFKDASAAPSLEQVVAALIAPV